MLLDPVVRAMATAPPDDEPVTEQDRRRFHGGQAWFAHQGKGIPMEDVLVECGLKSDVRALDQPTAMRIFGVRHRSEAYR
ncbi:MAG: hypothetical protein HY235_11965 [Acidobacteria bacterium]|nr:hypothetical protein [Acidobacteriota bacterium]